MTYVLALLLTLLGTVWYVIDGEPEVPEHTEQLHATRPVTLSVTRVGRREHEITLSDDTNV